MVSVHGPFKPYTVEEGIRYPRFEGTAVHTAVSATTVGKIEAEYERNRQIQPFDGGPIYLAETGLADKCGYIRGKLKRMVTAIDSLNGVRRLCFATIRQRCKRRQLELDFLQERGQTLLQHCDKIDRLFSKEHKGIREHIKADILTMHDQKVLNNLRNRVCYLAGNDNLHFVDRSLADRAFKAQVQLEALYKMRELRQKGAALKGLDRRFTATNKVYVARNGKKGAEKEERLKNAALDAYIEQVRDLRGLEGYLSRLGLALPRDLAEFQQYAKSVLDSVVEADVRDPAHFSQYPCSREDAEERMKYWRPGSYFIRPDSQSGAHLLTAVSKTGEMLHERLEIRNDELYLIRGTEPSDATRIRTVKNCLNYMGLEQTNPVRHDESSLTPAQMLDDRRYVHQFAGVDTVADANTEAERLLSDLPEGSFIVYRVGDERALSFKNEAGEIEHRALTTVEGSVQINGELVNNFACYVGTATNVWPNIWTVSAELQRWIKAGVRFQPSVKAVKEALTKPGQYAVCPARVKGRYWVGLMNWAEDQALNWCRISVQNGVLQAIGPFGGVRETYHADTFEESMETLLNSSHMRAMNADLDPCGAEQKISNDD